MKDFMPKNARNTNSPFFTSTASSNSELNVGQRLRIIRAERGLSIKVLAELSGLNVNTLSLIENGRTSPSVNTLQQLSQALQIPITSFFENNRGHSTIVFQKSGERPQSIFSQGEVADLASGMSHFGAEPVIITLNPYADSGRTPIVHTGREFVFCIEGKIVYTVEDKTYILEPGDSLIFEAYLPHQWKNPNATPSRALLILCAMDERENPSDRHFLK